MKILLTNNTLHLLAGSEMFIYDLATTLKGFGHEIHVIPQEEFDVKTQPIPKELTAAGIKCISAIEDLDKDYDFIHCQHNNITNFVNYRLPQIPKVFVSHGIVFDICKPNLDIKFKKIIAVSEEIKEKLTREDYKNIKIIRNVLNTDKFKFRKKKYKKIKQICIASNHAGKMCKKAGFDCEAYEKYKQPYFIDHCFHDCELKPFRQALKIAEHNKARLFYVGGFTYINEEGKLTGEPKPVWNVDEAYEEADLVIGIGRSALSAMSQGVPTLVYDHFGYAGFIKTKKQFKELQKTNFSARPWLKVVNDFPILDQEKFKLEWTEQLERLEWLSDLVKEEYGHEKIGRQYEQLYKSCM